MPEENPRGRILGRHRSQPRRGPSADSGELGLISDRNFLEQYYEQEWDEEKDQTTGVEMSNGQRGDHSWSISSDVRANDFFTQTEWLPRFDHFWLGHPLLSDWLNWTEHTNVGYAKLRTLTEPLNPLADWPRRIRSPGKWALTSNGKACGPPRARNCRCRLDWAPTQDRAVRAGRGRLLEAGSGRQ